MLQLVWIDLSTILMESAARLKEAQSLSGEQFMV